MPLILLREPTREDKLFVDLRRAVPKPHKREQHMNSWISDETWRLVDERVLARRGTRVRARLRRLGRAVRASLKGDRRQRVEEAGKAVEALLRGRFSKRKRGVAADEQMVPGCSKKRSAARSSYT